MFSSVDDLDNDFREAISSSRSGLNFQVVLYLFGASFVSVAACMMGNVGASAPIYPILLGALGVWILFITLIVMQVKSLNRFIEYAQFATGIKRNCAFTEITLLSAGCYVVISQNRTDKCFAVDLQNNNGQEPYRKAFLQTKDLESSFPWPSDALALGIEGKLPVVNKQVQALMDPETNTPVALKHNGRVYWLLKGKLKTPQIQLNDSPELRKGMQSKAIAMLCMIVAGFTITVFNQKSFFDFVDDRDWAVTNGIVTQSYSTSSTGKNAHAAASISYKFHVAGKEYNSNDSETFSGPDMASKAGEVSSRIPLNSMVSLKYSPNNPVKSYIIRTDRPRSLTELAPKLVLYWLGIIMMIVGLSVLRLWSVAFGVAAIAVAFCFMPH
ncbi:MAG: DUF3592 domain-containing protein [Candidatus Obscuribacterales bacterium]|nr:DUF3592 domain-containing protein [Candidatus Obscuribacterales bacterium]